MHKKRLSGSIYGEIKDLRLKVQVHFGILKCSAIRRAGGFISLGYCFNTDTGSADHMCCAIR